MNNILMNFLIYFIEYICGEPEPVIDKEKYDLPDNGYFFYDLETLECASLYE